jgi:flagellar motility protein MotE (MotC chaperone)
MRPTALPILGLTLILSALVSLTDSGSAFVRRANALEASQPSESSSMALCQTDTDLQRVLDALLVREEGIATTELQLNQRLATVRKLEAEAEKRITQAEEAEAALKATMALAQTASETDLGQLTNVYQKMKPKNAASLFQEMEPAFAAGFLARMKPEAAAPILASMDAQAAYAISVTLAGRNANAGKTK